MKKFLVLIAATALVAAIALPSFAADTTISGTYRIRSVMEYGWDKQLQDPVPAAGNVLFTGSVISHNEPLYSGYFDQRFRITLTHTRSEFLKAVVVADLVEDTWGQGRSLRWDNTDNTVGTNDGWINAAYIEAITPIGLINVGAGLESRFGSGIWSDSGMYSDGSKNFGVTYAIKVGPWVATATYKKYIDFVQPIFANAMNANANAFMTWPGRNGLDNIGGPGSSNYNLDVDTYVITAHYITDKVKVGALIQLVLDPRNLGGGYLVKGVTDFTSFPGPTFQGEGGRLATYGTFAPAMILVDAFPPATTEQYIAALWPTAIPAYPDQLGGGDAYPNPSVGMGSMGMYGNTILVFGLYANLKFFDDKLQIKGEIDRIWGYSDINAYGRGYNAYLNWVQNLALGTAMGTTLGGTPMLYAGTTLMPGQRLPDKIGIDGMNVHVDISYHTDLFTIGAAFLYGSGEKHWTPYTQSHKTLNTTGNGDFRWSNIIVPGNGEFLMATSAPLGMYDNEENVTSAKLYWSVCPFDNLDIHGAFIWAKYTEPVGRYAMDENLNLVENWHAYYGHPMNYLNGNYGYIPANVSDDLGWEIDFGVTWSIMEGLTLNSEFGVLFTGDAFDYRNTVTGEREDWGEIYRWVNTLTFEF